MISLTEKTNVKSCRLEVFCKKMFYKVSFFNKVAGWSPTAESFFSKSASTGLSHKKLWRLVPQIKTMITLVEQVEKLPQACKFIKKETLAQVFSFKFWEISKNTSFYRTLLDDCFWRLTCKLASMNSCYSTIGSSTRKWRYEVLTKK